MKQDRETKIVTELSQNICTQTFEESQLWRSNPFIKIQLNECNIQGYNKQMTNIQYIDKQINKQTYKRQLIQSMQRRYQLQLNKYKQLYLIKQRKLIQQIQQLTTQNLLLKNQNKQLLNQIKSKSFLQQISQITFQSNKQSPAVLNQIQNLTSMLNSLQHQHQNCISNKKILLDQKQTLLIKINILQKQSKQLSSQLKQYKQKITHINSLETSNLNYLKEIQKLKMQVNTLRVINQQQQQQFNSELNNLQKQIQNIQAQSVNNYQSVNNQTNRIQNQRNKQNYNRQQRQNKKEYLYQQNKKLMSFSNQQNQYNNYQILNRQINQSQRNYQTNNNSYYDNNINEGNFNDQNTKRYQYAQNSYNSINSQTQRIPLNNLYDSHLYDNNTVYSNSNSRYKDNYNHRSKQVSRSKQNQYQRNNQPGQIQKKILLGKDIIEQMYKKSLLHLNQPINIHNQNHPYSSYNKNQYSNLNSTLLSARTKMLSINKIVQNNKNYNQIQSMLELKYPYSSRGTKTNNSDNKILNKRFQYI